MTAMPPLGGETGWVKHCVYEMPPDDHHCGVVATVHLLWSDDGDNSVACDEHAVDARARFRVLDEHPVGACCSMPGATWDFAEKRCLVEGVDTTVPELVAAVNQQAEIRHSMRTRATPGIVR